MTNFNIDPAIREKEMRAIRQRSLSLDRIFLLLLGPSATGKSTIIRNLNKVDNDLHFQYVEPVITRELREGEVDKISVSEDEFTKMESSGEFVVVNKLYGVRYGTPLRGILEPLRSGKIPVLDFPLGRVNSLRRPEYDLFSVYVYPPSLDEWRKRMEGTGRNTDGRLEAGIAELGHLATSNYVNPGIDVSIINSSGSPERAAEEIADIIKTSV